MSDDYLAMLKRTKTSVYKRFKHREGGGFVNCCKEFKFIRDFDTYNFNKKMNHLGITDLVLNDKEYNLYKMIQNTVENPIKYNSNVIIGIIGETGSGKSELAQALSLISRETNKKYKNRDVKIHICWTPADLFNALKELKKGDVVMKDESPKAFEKGALIEKWSIENYLAVIRKMENTFIFCDPRDIKIKICDLYLETAGMNLETRTNRFMVLNKEKMYFGHIYNKLHEDIEFRNRYEKEKDVFVKKTIELAGKFLSGLRKDKIIDTDFVDNKQGEKSKEIVGTFPIKSIEYLREYLKKKIGNKITVKEYSELLDVSIQVARRFLKNFVKEKELGFWRETKGVHVYYCKR